MQKVQVSKVSKKKILKDRPIPAFLTKLYLIVNDPATDDLISWSEDNKSFVVKNSEKFSIQILPKYFKHSNFTSFVRQLNMYGFHKQPALLSSPDCFEFRNDNFIKSRQDLLSSIAKTREDKQVSDQKLDLQELLVEIGQIKVQQQAISSEIMQIQQSNQAMWEQSVLLSKHYQEQKDTIEKIVGFLASVFTKSGDDGVEEGGRRLLNAKSLSEEENEFVKREISTLLKPSTPWNIPYTTPQSLDNLGSKANALSQDIEILQDRLLDISDLVGYTGNENMWTDGLQFGLSGQTKQNGLRQASSSEIGLDPIMSSGLQDQGLSTGLEPLSAGIQDQGLTTGLDPMIPSGLQNPGLTVGLDPMLSSGLQDQGLDTMLSGGLEAEYVEPKELNFEDFFHDQQE